MKKKKIQKVIKNVISFLNNVNHKSYNIIIKTYHSNKLNIYVCILKINILAKEYFSSDGHNKISIIENKTKKHVNSILVT